MMTGMGESSPAIHGAIAPDSKGYGRVGTEINEDLRALPVDGEHEVTLTPLN